MSIQTCKNILLLIFVSGTFITSFNLSATENDTSETQINTPEIPIELTRQTTSENSDGPETIEYSPQNDEMVSTEDNLNLTEQTPLNILDEIVQPGELRVLSWSAGQSFSGRPVKPPVLVVRGLNSGPALCLIAAIHGDELNGIEIVRRVVRSLDPIQVSGTVIGVPIVNLFGFTSNTRYLPDRRDLNRYFPGTVEGSAASRIAYRFFNQIIKHCDLVVDFHTGSFKRTNLPQLRADMNDPFIKEFVRHFGSTSVLHKSGHGNTLRAAATHSGIPTVAFELGQPGSLQNEYVKFGVKSIGTLIGKLGILKKFHLWVKPQPIYYSSRWVRVNSGGILNSNIKLGSKVIINDLLGHVINPLTNEEIEIRSPVKGRVLGMALNQYMLPGYAAFHIGVSSTVSTMIHDEQLSNNVDEDDDSDETEDGYDIQTNDDEQFH